MQRVLTSQRPADGHNMPGYFSAVKTICGPNTEGPTKSHPGNRVKSSFDRGAIESIAQQPIWATPDQEKVKFIFQLKKTL